MINFCNPELLLAADQFYWTALRQHLLKFKLDDQQMLAIACVASASNYALQELSKHPKRALELPGLTEFTLPSQPIISDTAEDVDLDQLKRSLRLFRHQKMIEIIYLDVVKKQPVDKTLQQLSDLADYLIRWALGSCYEQACAIHGTPRLENGSPMQLNVIAMGKLGGRELNFSSDIDLICCYAHDGALRGFGHLDYHEFFGRLAKTLIQVLSDNTEDGFVYRVDLRLRPWGQSGPVVLSHAALEHYYQVHGRDWEQFALVKARMLTGEAEDKHSLEKIIKPFVYRRYRDHRLFDSLAAMKYRISQQVKTDKLNDNIKLGPGGIREVEFFVQTLQLLHGGRNHRLQSTELLSNLAALSDERLLESSTAEQLTNAYRFLRQLENRLQMFADQQTHELPADNRQQQRLAQAMGADNWQTIVAQLRDAQATVSQHFDALFGAKIPSAQGMEFDINPADGGLTKEQFADIKACGISELEDVTEALSRFLHSRHWCVMSSNARHRFGQLLPQLLNTVAGFDQQAEVFQRLLNLIAAISGRSLYFDLLASNPALQYRLVKLCHDSQWIAETLARFPILLENLAPSDDEAKFDYQTLSQRLQHQLHTVSGDVELELDCLRVFKLEQTLTIACAEIAGEIDAQQTGIYLSELAEIILGAVLELASAEMQTGHGLPMCSDNGKVRQANLAIIAYGKLGSRELHYQSDLDLVFLHDSTGAAQCSDGENSLENADYFARVVQKILSITNFTTTSGRLYEIDCRLRPEGSSGLLVSSIDAFQRYQKTRARTWEYLALLRSRPVAGSAQLKTEFANLRTALLSTAIEQSTMRRDISEMRQQMREQLDNTAAGIFDLKHSAGGLIDIEFLTQFWVLSRANSVGSVCSYSDTISWLNELFRLALITDTQFKLAAIYQHYHQLLHQQVLQHAAGVISHDRVADEAAHVVQCWQACFAEVEI